MAKESESLTFEDLTLIVEKFMNSLRTVIYYDDEGLKKTVKEFLFDNCNILEINKETLENEINSLMPGAKDLEKRLQILDKYNRITREFLEKEKSTEKQDDIDASLDFYKSKQQEIEDAIKSINRSSGRADVDNKLEIISTAYEDIISNFETKHNIILSFPKAVVLFADKKVNMEDSPIIEAIDEYSLGIIDKNEKNNIVSLCYKELNSTYDTIRQQLKGDSKKEQKPKKGQTQEPKPKKGQTQEPKKVLFGDFLYRKLDEIIKCFDAMKPEVSILGNVNQNIQEQNDDLVNQIEQCVNQCNLAFKQVKLKDNKGNIANITYEMLFPKDVNEDTLRERIPRKIRKGILNAISDKLQDFFDNANKLKGNVGIDEDEINKLTNNNPGTPKQGDDNEETKSSKKGLVAIIGVALGLTALAIVLKQACNTKKNGAVLPPDYTPEPFTPSTEEPATEIPSLTEAPTEIPTEVPTEAPTAEPTIAPNEEDIENPLYQVYYSEVARVYNVPYSKAVNYVNRAAKAMETEFFGEADLYEIVELLIHIDNKDLFYYEFRDTAQLVSTGLDPILERYITGETTDEDAIKMDAFKYLAPKGTDLDDFFEELSKLCKAVINNEPNAQENLANFICILYSTLNGYENSQIYLMSDIIHMEAIDHETDCIPGHNINDTGYSEDFVGAAITHDYHDSFMAIRHFISNIYTLLYNGDPVWNNAVFKLQVLIETAMNDPMYQDICGEARKLGGN